MKSRERDMKLVGPWRSLHGAVWLIGLAILFWQGWVWPGILVLVAISMLVEALLMQFVPQAVEKAEPMASEPPAPSPMPAASPVREHRLELLPSSCPKCNGPIRGHEVRWTGPQSADCPHCGANLPMQKG
jgi:hypothetical protein